MPSPQGPELRDKILELWKSDKTLTGKEIGRRLGCTGSTAQYHIHKYRLANGEKVAPGPNVGKKPWNATSDKVEREVLNYRVRGMQISDIAKKVGISMATVHRIVRDGKKNEHPQAALAHSLVKQHTLTPKQLAGQAFAEKVADLKASGLSITAIAKQLGRHKSSIYSATHYWKKHGVKQKQNLKGAIELHGHVNGNTNGHPGNAPTKAELIGFAWAHVERGITDIASRSSLPPEVLRRRLSELLGYTALR